MGRKRALFSNKVLVMCVYIFTLIIFCIMGCSRLKERPKVVDGTLNLENWNLDLDGVIPLNGEWEFYWEQLLYPEDFALDQSSEESSLERILVKVPNNWTKYKVMGKPLDSGGHATFRLLIYLEDSINNIGIRLPGINSSYRLWINGELTNEVGLVDKSKKGSLPKVFPDYVYFKAKNFGNSNKTEKNSLEIILQVANYEHRRGGIWQSLVLGSDKQIKSLQEKNLFLDIFVFTGLLIIGFYLVSLYIATRKNLYTLYFGVSSLILSLRTTLLGEAYLVLLLPRISREVFLKIEYLTYCFSLVFIILSLETYFNEETNKKICLFLELAGLLFAVFVIVTPASLFNRYLIFMQTITFLTGIYSIIVYCLALKNGRKSMVLLFIGALFLNGTVVNDVLLFNGIITTRSYASLGFLGFIVVHFYVILMQPSGHFLKNKKVLRYLSRIDISEKDSFNNGNMNCRNALDRFLESITSTFNLSEIFEILLKTLSCYIPYDYGVVVLKRKKNASRVVTAIKLSNAANSGRRYSNNYLVDSDRFQPILNMFSDQSRKNNQRVAERKRYYISGNRIREEKTILAAPIVCKNEVLGVVILQSNTKNAFRELDGEIAYNFAVQSGIAIRNAQLFYETRKLASTDDLTGINNRREFFKLADREFKLFKRQKKYKELSMIMLDVDDFKKVNDTYGHRTGDNVLQTVAKKCVKTLRETDIMGRYGGEEFGILLPYAGVQESLKAAERLKKNISEEPILLGNASIYITVSMGIAVLDESVDTFEELLNRADIALYKAKQKGKNCIEVF